MATNKLITSSSKAGPKEKAKASPKSAANTTKKVAKATTKKAAKAAAKTTPTKASPKKVSKASPKSAAKASPKKVSKASSLLDQGDWREETLARMRALILEAEPAMLEERKWRKPSNGMVGVPVWSHEGIVCTGETYKSVVKLTFAHGASLPDPSRLFNASLEGGTRRAIDIPEGAKVNERAFKALVQAAVARNTAEKKH